MGGGVGWMDTSLAIRPFVEYSVGWYGNRYFSQESVWGVGKRSLSVQHFVVSDCKLCSFSKMVKTVRLSLCRFLERQLVLMGSYMGW